MSTRHQNWRKGETKAAVNSQIGSEWYEQKCSMEYVKTCSENIFSATVHFPKRERHLLSGAFSIELSVLW